MIDIDGYFFHIDFGFIFGTEPKFKGMFASPIRISTEMIDVMCEYDKDNSVFKREGKNYELFKETSKKAFKVLRKSKNYIMNLIYLCIDSNLPNLPYD